MKTVTFGTPEADLVLIQPVDERELAGMEREVNAIREGADVDFCLTAFVVEDWNKELSPWAAPAVFGREDFGDGAAETLGEILSLCGDGEKTYYLGGYSLAGLFALWAACRTDRFRGVAAASPSVWFPGFTDHLQKNGPRCGAAYLSLGDREEKTRNPIMATVGERIRETYDILQSQNVSCALEWNPGNHFRDADLRTAKGFAWLLRHDQGENGTGG